MNRRLPGPISTDLGKLTPEIPPSVFSASFRDACFRLDSFIDALLVGLRDTLALTPGEALSADSLVRARGWQEGSRWAVLWLLENLELFGRAERRGEEFFLLPGSAPHTRATIREEAVQALPATAPSFEVMARSAEALPGVLRGEMRGEEALFGPATLGLWFDYFSNSNPLYAPNNAITAVAVARQAGDRARLLEVGGGGGSCAEAVLAALAEAGTKPSHYCFTELQPAFLRRGTRAVRAAAPPSCEVASRVLDINRTPGIEELGGEPFDVILGVNTLHLATDVVATLQAMRGLLRSGGVLVIGELMRPEGTGAVHLELPFVLLDSYRDVHLHPDVRPRPGFMTAEGWTRAATLAGFSRSELIPAALARCVRGYAGFYAGALVAHA